MRKLVVNTFLTLDGVMQAPGGPEEDESGGFAYGGWTFHYFDEKMGESMDGLLGRPFDLLLGRKTYEIFAAHWPHSTDDPAKPFNEATKYVATRTLTSLEWENSVVIEGDVAESIATLKQGDGPELHVHGSGHLLQTLLKNNLIDELRLFTFPVLLGNGKRLFADGTIPVGLKLVDHFVSSTGVLMGTYVPAGEVKTGSFAPDA